MSREYIYHPVLKEDGKYKPVAYTEINGNKRIANIGWNNADYIEEKFKADIENNRIDIDTMSDELKELIFDDDMDSLDNIDKNMIFIYEISNDLLGKYKGDGLIKGYMPVDIVIECEAGDYLSDYKESLISADIYAALPKKKQNEYMQVAFIDYCSGSFIASNLLRALDNIPYYTWGKACKGELCVLVYYSY